MAVKICAKMGNAKMASLWMEKLLEAEVICVGEDSPEYFGSMKITQYLKKAVESPDSFALKNIAWGNEVTMGRPSPLIALPQL